MSIWLWLLFITLGLLAFLLVAFVGSAVVAAMIDGFRSSRPCEHCGHVREGQAMTILEQFRELFRLLWRWPELLATRVEAQEAQRLGQMEHLKADARALGWNDVQVQRLLDFWQSQRMRPDLDLIREDLSWMNPKDWDS